MRQRHGCGELLVQPRRCSAAKCIGDSNTRALALAHAQIRRKTHHDPPVKLLDKADLFWVCLLGSTRPIPLLILRRLLILENAVDVRKVGRLLALLVLVCSGHVCRLNGRCWSLEKNFSLSRVWTPCIYGPVHDHRAGSGEAGGASEPGERKNLG